MKKHNFNLDAMHLKKNCKGFNSIHTFIKPCSNTSKNFTNFNPISTKLNL